VGLRLFRTKNLDRHSWRNHRKLRKKDLKREGGGTSWSLEKKERNTMVEFTYEKVGKKTDSIIEGTSNRDKNKEARKQE